MNSICIAGAVEDYLQLVANILQHGGMQLPKPAQRGEPIDMAFWHKQVLALAAEESNNVQPIATVGRLWEQLASDIFVANIDSKLWGWSDTRSTWLLDFWLNFEPRLKFILVYVSPQQMLASAMRTEADSVSVAALMNVWQIHHQELLRFHHRNPQRSLLVNARECAEHPGALIEHCATHWKLPLEAVTSAAPAPIEHDALALYLAQQLCRSYPQTTSLQHELAATVTRLGDAEPVARAIAPEPEQIIADYRGLRDRSAELRQVQAAREELALALATLRDEREMEVAALIRARNEQGARAAEHQIKIESLTQERDSDARQASVRQGQIDALSKTNVTLIKEKSTVEAQRDTLQAEVTALTKIRDEQSKLAADRQIRVQALTQERDSHARQAAERQAQMEQQQKDAATRLKDATQENELMLLQLHQVQEELEATFLKHESKQQQIEALTQERDSHARQASVRQGQIDALSKTNATLIKEKSTVEAQRDTLQAEVTALTKARDEQGKLAAERQAQMEKQPKDAAAKLKEATQENELILLQLHQVQEELEHYFLQHQDVQKQLNAANERWQRMLQRKPDYCDYESIELLAADGGESTGATWRIKNLNAAGRSLPELEFKTIIEGGDAGFVLTRQPGTTGPLIRWPSDAANQDELTLFLVGSRANFLEHIEALCDLATSDWDLLNTLTRLLASTLLTPATLRATANFQPEALRNGLGKLGAFIEKFPVTLRYDSVTLKNEQVNPDYEHLWLRFENLALGANRWPEFEFRLSCGDLRPNHFGTHPKLEFPEAHGRAPFEAWFIESEDDFGPKLELRFALPESMDIDVWQRVSESDRAFLLALIERLPAILGALRSTGTKLHRPWDDWDMLAREIQRVVALNTTVLPEPVSALPARDKSTQSIDFIEKKNNRCLNAPPEVKTARNTSAKPVSGRKAAKPSRVPKTRNA